MKHWELVCASLLCAMDATWATAQDTQPRPSPPVLQGGVSTTVPANPCKALQDAEERRHREVYVALQAKEQQSEVERVRKYKACRADEGCQKSVNEAASARSREISQEARAEDAEHDRREREISKQCADMHKKPEPKGGKADSGPPLSGGVELDPGRPASRQGPVAVPAPRPGRPSTSPSSGGASSGGGGNSDNSAAGAAAMAAAGAFWHLKVAEGVTLTLCEDAAKGALTQAGQAAGRVIVTTGGGMVAACMEESLAAGTAASAAAGMICVSGSALDRLINKAKQLPDPRWDDHHRRSLADRDFLQRAQQYAREVNQSSGSLLEEALRSAENQQKLAGEQKRLLELRSRIDRIRDSAQRDIEARRYEQSRKNLERMQREEAQRHVQADRQIRQQMGQLREQFKRDAQLLVDANAQTEQQRRREAQQVNRLAAELEKRAAAPQPQPGQRTPQPVDPARLSRFRLEWESQWERYMGYLDGWWAEWRFEEQRHSQNPFKTQAENERHARELARLNASARCLQGDHLAKLDEIRLKYRLW